MRCLFTDVLGGTSRTKFLTEHWNKQPLLASLAEDELLRDGFCDGELSAIIAECRKPDNSEYSTGEREDMERELDEHARTLNLPYCFCSGARELHDLAVDAFGDLANDIEVGVYMSKAGGARGGMALRQQPQHYHPAHGCKGLVCPARRRSPRRSAAWQVRPTSKRGGASAIGEVHATPERCAVLSA